MTIKNKPTYAARSTVKEERKEERSAGSVLSPPSGLGSLFSRVFLSLSLSFFFYYSGLSLMQDKARKAGILCSEKKKKKKKKKDRGKGTAKQQQSSAAGSPKRNKKRFKKYLFRKSRKQIKACFSTKKTLPLPTLEENSPSPQPASPVTQTGTSGRPPSASPAPSCPPRPSPRRSPPSSPAA